jgi:endonuclease/exonuclease/phosphatase family metal-dependent hydrolase
MSELVCASYNIHRCIGRDRRHDPDRIAGVLRELDAGVVGLQEIAAREGSEGDVDQLDHVARAAGYQAVRAPTHHHARGYLANGLLCRGRVIDVTRVDLSLAGREPRGLLDVRLQHSGSSLRVLVTHFGLSAIDRLIQARRLLEVLGDDREQPTIVLGDINEWFPGPALRRLHARLGRTPAVATFPSGRPILALDRIWVQPRAALIEVRAHTTPLARMASDHLPVKGTVRWTTPGA